MVEGRDGRHSEYSSREYVQQVCLNKDRQPPFLLRRRGVLSAPGHGTESTCQQSPYDISARLTLVRLLVFRKKLPPKQKKKAPRAFSEPILRLRAALRLAQDRPRANGRPARAERNPEGEIEAGAGPEPAEAGSGRGPPVRPAGLCRGGRHVRSRVPELLRWVTALENFSANPQASRAGTREAI